MGRKRGRRSIVKDIHRVYSYGNPLAALPFGGNNWRGADIFILHMLFQHLQPMVGFEGLTYWAALLCVNDWDNAGIPVTSRALEGALSLPVSRLVIKRVKKLGMIEKHPYPATYSHIPERAVYCYKLTDKGHEAVRLFNTELKRAYAIGKQYKLSYLEQLKG